MGEKNVKRYKKDKNTKRKLEIFIIMKYFFHLVFVLLYIFLIFFIISFMNIKIDENQKEINEKNILIDSLYLEINKNKIK